MKHGMRTTRTSGKLFEGSGYSKASNQKRMYLYLRKTEPQKRSCYHKSIKNSNTMRVIIMYNVEEM
jgi:hypothetical protein